MKCLILICRIESAHIQKCCYVFKIIEIPGDSLFRQNQHFCLSPVQ